MNQPALQTVNTSFSELILGFSSAALYYLGLEQIEGASTEKVNKELAIYNMKIIELLEIKTKGNLTKEEADLMKEVLDNLKSKMI